MMDGFGHFWGMGWGWFMGPVIIVLVIWIIVRTINQNNYQQKITEKTPLDILKERYARGEIDKKEYEEKRKDLS